MKRLGGFNVPWKSLCKMTFLTAAFLVGALITTPSGGFAGASELNILHSNNLTGYVFACPT